MISAQEALERLKEGNRRFLADDDNSHKLTYKTGFKWIPEQHPFAVILGCADSRVPAEIIFDQGVGDLFVIRVAGNVAAPSQIGSVEYAAEHIGSRLVVVLGHSNCGAVQATLEEMEQPSDGLSPSLTTIVDRIRPALEELGKPDDTDALMEKAVRANINTSVNHLRHGSEILERLIDTDGLLIVGAEYSLETGAVEFFDN
ncbi:MAG: carbonic anhydrase [Gammaproteobacteria bacterium]|jgi:carbonic anhydrase|nr:carbonic anhydrase [Gammaproteobacteria bacterium]MDP6617191.1 carbonic anhydrase [Gammaproteobacteria bacterium]MDP6695400.1 carbonic anhydrase [Gammaproteobacteria bacterium]